MCNKSSNIIIPLSFPLPLPLPLSLRLSLSVMTVHAFLYSISEKCLVKFGLGSDPIENGLDRIIFISMTTPRIMLYFEETVEK